jgi:hypothetical protein
MHFDAFFREMSRIAAAAKQNGAFLPRPKRRIMARPIMLNGSPMRSSSIQNHGRHRTARLESPLSRADAS